MTIHYEMLNYKNSIVHHT